MSQCQTNVQPIVFFRDDDVGELNASIVRITELFQKLETPLSLEVIPKNVQKEFVDYYNSLKLKDLFDIGQHGYAHTLYQEKAVNKGEFGTNRSMIDKRNDIVSGWKIIEKNFGVSFPKTFVPPWGLADQETFEILHDLNYNAFSCINGSKGSNFIRNLFATPPQFIAFKKYGMLNLSTSIDNMKYFERKIPITTRQLIMKFKKINKNTKYIGVMLHDKIMDDNAFNALEEFIVYLKKNKVKIMNMTEIIKKHNGSLDNKTI